MRHIITGGSGFTGTALTRRLLERGDTVVHFDLVPHADTQLARQVSFLRGDVCSVSDLRQLGIGPDDAVYHLAARQFANAVPARGRMEWFCEVNVGGTRNLIEAMRPAGRGKLVLFSTDMTYGKPTQCPVPPTHAQNPLGPYGGSKLEAERVLRSAAWLNATIFRPRLITGPGRLGILGKLFGLIRAGLPVPLIGSGSNRYQMVGVDDCARAALLAVDAGCPPGPFNLGSDNPPTSRALLQAVVDHAGSRSILIGCPAAPLKFVLSTLDSLGLTLLYPEQFGIADIDILLDTSETQRQLGWRASATDIEMMTAAYTAFLNAPVA